jgi:hypothetical protein
MKSNKNIQRRNIYKLKTLRTNKKHLEASLKHAHRGLANPN